MCHSDNLMSGCGLDRRDLSWVPVPPFVGSRCSARCPDVGRGRPSSAVEPGAAPPLASWEDGRGGSCKESRRGSGRASPCSNATPRHTLHGASEAAPGSGRWRLGGSGRQKDPRPLQPGCTGNSDAPVLRSLTSSPTSSLTREWHLKHAPPCGPQRHTLPVPQTGLPRSSRQGRLLPHSKRVSTRPSTCPFTRPPGQRGERAGP